MSSDDGRGFRAIWPHGTPLIGMVHLPALPGAPGWSGSMEALLEQALADARALCDAGFDGLIVENYADVPFHSHTVPPETIAAMSVATDRIVRRASCPVGVNVLRNDAGAALGVAVATGARFVRVNVHTGSMWTDQGLIEGRAAHTLRARTALGATVAIFADVHVKHATPPAGESIEAAAADAWSRGRADALIVSGTGTGTSTRLADLEAVRHAVPGAPVLVGSGATPQTIRRLLERADGVIVGSAVMRGGLAGSGVDPQRARAFVEAARG